MSREFYLKLGLVVSFIVWVLVWLVIFGIITVQAGDTPPETPAPTEKVDTPVVTQEVDTPVVTERVNTPVVTEDVPGVTPSTEIVVNTDTPDTTTHKEKERNKADPTPSELPPTGKGDTGNMFTRVMLFAAAFLFVFAAAALIRRLT